MIGIMKQLITSLDDLSEFARSLKPELTPGTICLLSGPMGVGKTTFVSAFMAQFGFDEVSSPSFSLVQEYEASLPVYHMDLYRLNSEREIEMLDLERYFCTRTHLVFLEWADRLSDFNFPFRELRFSRADRGRLITFH